MELQIEKDYVCTEQLSARLHLKAYLFDKLST